MSELADQKQLAIRLYVELVSSTSTKQDLDDGHDPASVHEKLAERAIMAAETFYLAWLVETRAQEQIRSSLAKCR